MVNQAYRWNRLDASFPTVPLVNHSSSSFMLLVRCHVTAGSQRCSAALWSIEALFWFRSWRRRKAKKTQTQFVRECTGRGRRRLSSPSGGGATRHDQGSIILFSQDESRDNSWTWNKLDIYFFSLRLARSIFIFYLFFIFFRATVAIWNPYFRSKIQKNHTTVQKYMSQTSNFSEDRWENAFDSFKTKKMKRCSTNFYAFSSFFQYFGLIFSDSIVKIIKK